MAIVGQIFLWTGFIGAALASVHQLELPSNPWQTIQWNWYAASMAIGFVGVVLLRTSSKAAEKHAGRVDGEFETLVSSLASLKSNIGELRQMQGSTDLRETVSFIDSRCTELFADFADSRNALVQRYGLKGFADVMTQFSSAERFVNRAWSAAADGYSTETKASLELADNYISRASQILSEYQSRQ